jgi:hypothetical protein
MTSWPPMTRTPNPCTAGVAHTCTRTARRTTLLNCQLAYMHAHAYAPFQHIVPRHTCNSPRVSVFLPWREVGVGMGVGMSPRGG